jgi:hypothetical protein
MGVCASTSNMIVQLTDDKKGRLVSKVGHSGHPFDMSSDDVVRVLPRYTAIVSFSLIRIFLTLVLFRCTTTVELEEDARDIIHRPFLLFLFLVR